MTEPKKPRKRVLCSRLPDPDHRVTLSTEESHHLTRVLRLQSGDQVIGMDQSGGVAIVELLVEKQADQEKVHLLWSHQSLPAKSQSVIHPITLEMAIVKASAMEWTIEKAVELGVARVIPVLTQRTVVKVISGEKFLNRWSRIANQSLKQCGRAVALQIDPPCQLRELLTGSRMKNYSNNDFEKEVRIWCDENAGIGSPHLMSWLNEHHSDPNLPLRILIGPEGGFSPEEQDLLKQKESHNHPTVQVSLGSLTMRAETAALYATSLCHGRIQTLI